jgi:formylglycine-generating enzyme required for sulfatase activity
MKKLKFVCCILAFFAVATASQADVFHMGPGLTSLEFVTIGNPGNAPDSRYNGIAVGSVDHVYQMGKYEITAGQYTEFLNAVAKTDPNELYHPELGDPSTTPNLPFGIPGVIGANIQRTGSSGNYSYSVAADWANRPVNYVTFWDAARFANWLHNGQLAAPEGPGTTEDGAYHGIGSFALFGRNPGAKFFIPTEDEWYKAAYHDKSAGLAASYFDYPTGSNSAPINTLPDAGNHANFYDYSGKGTSSYTIGAPYYRTEVGAFVNSASPYGTFDQGGNVDEWIQTVQFGIGCGLRGGALDGYTDPLNASERFDYYPTLDFYNIGFRMAGVVPEPSALVLGVLAALGLLAVPDRRPRSTTP